MGKVPHLFLLIAARGEKQACRSATGMRSDRTGDMNVRMRQITGQKNVGFNGMSLSDQVENLSGDCSREQPRQMQYRGILIQTQQPLCDINGVSMRRKPDWLWKVNQWPFKYGLFNVIQQISIVYVSDAALNIFHCRTRICAPWWTRQTIGQS